MKGLESCKQDEELLDLLEELQTENEALKAEKQKNSSERSKLRSALSEAKLIIEGLNKENDSLTSENRKMKEHIVSMNNADLKLKELNRKERQLSEKEETILNFEKQCEEKIHKAGEKVEIVIADRDRRISQIKHEADDKIRATEEKCKKDNTEAEKARTEAEKYRKEWRRLLNEQNTEIEKAAEQKIKNCREELKREYRNMVLRQNSLFNAKFSAADGWYVFVFIFSVVWLIIQALTSKYFYGCICEAAKVVASYFVFMANITEKITLEAARFVSGGAELNFIGWIVLVLVGLIMIIVLFIVPLALSAGTVFLYMFSEKFDKVQQWLFVASLMFIVAISSNVIGISSYNIILWWFVLQISVPITRFAVVPVVTEYFDEEAYMRADMREIWKYTSIAVITAVEIAVFLFWLWKCVI